MISKYHKLNRGIHIHIIRVHSWSCDIFMNSPEWYKKWPDFLHFRSTSGQTIRLKLRKTEETDTQTLFCIFLKICLKSFWSFFRRRGQAGFTPYSETEILSDDLENNHVSKVTEFLLGTITCLNIKWLIYKYQKCSNLSSYVLVCSYEPYPFAQSNIVHFMFGIRRVKSVIYASLSHTIKNFYNLYCIV